MSRRWIRLDAEWTESPWLEVLPGEVSGCWPKLLAWVKLRGQAGVIRAPHYSVLAKHWNVSPEVVAALIVAAQEDGAIELHGDSLVVSNWATYQEIDPKATERKRRQRAKSHGESRLSRRDIDKDGRDPSLSLSVSVVGGTEEAGSRAREGFDPERPWEGLDPLAIASIRGCYGGAGRTGTDEFVWAGANGMDREAALTTAVLRYRGAGDQEFNGKFFRKILTAVIAERKDAHDPKEKLW